MGFDDGSREKDVSGQTQRPLDSVPMFMARWLPPPLLP